MVVDISSWSCRSFAAVAAVTASYSDSGGGHCRASAPLTIDNVPSASLLS